MNIAPLAIFIFLISIPGIIFIETCRSGTKGFPSQKINFAERIAFSFIWSLLLHYIVHLCWTYFVEAAFKYVGLSTENIGLNKDIIIGLITAGRNNNSGLSLHSSITQLCNNLHYCIIYFLLMCLSAPLLGIVANRLSAGTSTGRWVFGIRTEWHHRIFPHLYKKKSDKKTIDGKDYLYSEIVPSISFTINLGGTAYLYKGSIKTYDYKSISFDSNGDLDTLQLNHACRRPIIFDEYRLSDCARRERYSEITGDVFIAKYSSIKALSISYTSPGESEESPDSGDKVKTSHPIYKWFFSIEKLFYIVIHSIWDWRSDKPNQK